MHANEPISVHIPRPASYTSFPDAINGLGDDSTSSGFQRTFSDNALSTIDRTEADVSPAHIASSTMQIRSESPSGILLDRQKSARSRPKPNITISKFALAAKAGGHDTTYESRNAVIPQVPLQDVASHSVTKSLSGFARKSWLSRSRSPSPSTPDGSDLTHDGTSSSSTTSILSASPPRAHGKDLALANGEADGSVITASRRGSVFGKKTRRPLSAFLQKNPAEPPLPRPPSMSSLRRSFSSDKLSSLNGSMLHSERVPPMPQLGAAEHNRALGQNVYKNKKKDELWSVFRALDADFQK